MVFITLMQFSKPIKGRGVHHPHIPHENRKPENLVSVTAHSLRLCTTYPWRFQSTNLTLQGWAGGRAGAKQDNEGH